MTTESNRYDITIRRGDCWSLVVTWSPSSGAVDLTGYTGEFALRWPRTASGIAPVVVAGTLESEPVVNSAAHTFTVSLESEDTLTIPKISDATYQMRAVDPSGCKTTIATGIASILSDIIDG